MTDADAPAIAADGSMTAVSDSGSWHVVMHVSYPIHQRNSRYLSAKGRVQ